MATFTPPIDSETTPMPLLHTPAAGSPSVAAQKMQRPLYRHFEGNPQGAHNVYILTDGSVTTETPQTIYNADGSILAEATSRIRRVFYSGHIPEDVTDAELAAIEAALSFTGGEHDLYGSDSYGVGDYGV